MSDDGQLDRPAEAQPEPTEQPLAQQPVQQPEQQPAPAPVGVTGVRPVPLPVGERPPTFNRRVVALIAAPLLLLAVLVCGLGALFAYDVSRSLTDTSTTSTDQSTTDQGTDQPATGQSSSTERETAPSGLSATTDKYVADSTTPADVIASVMWAGGRYAVAQQWDASSAKPVVTVWDSMTDMTRRLEGYHVVAVEPASTRLWLVADDGKGLVRALAKAQQSFDGVVGPAGDVAADGMDSPQAKMTLWDVAEAGKTPNAEAPFAWQRWAGPGPWGLELSVDPGVGAYPTTLTFSRNDGSGSKVKAHLPRSIGVRTWEPLSWSPSGRYVLLRPLPRIDVAAPLDSAIMPAPVVLDATTGEAMSWPSKVMPPESDDLKPAVAWDDETDALYGMTLDTATSTYALRTVRPDDTVSDVPVLHDDGSSVFAAYAPYASLTAEDPGAPLFTMSDVDGSGVFYEQAWIIHAGVSRSVGRFDDAGAVDAKYSPTAGMFVVHRWSDGLPSGYDVLWPDGTLKAVIPEVSAR